MGKGQRSREARAGKREEMKKAAAKQLRRKKFNKIIGICVAVVAVIGIAAVVIYNSIASTGYFLRNTIALSTENYKVDNAMMTYYVKNQYYSFANQNSEYLSMYGLDTSKSLKEQSYGDGTWLDYFVEQAKTQANDLLLLAEKAKAEGYSLDEEDNKSIDDAIASFKTYADSSNMTLDAYFSNMFGRGINEDDIRRAMNLTQIASKYYEDYDAKIKYTDDELQKYFNENKEDYIKADYISHSFTASYNSNATDDEKAAAKADAKAKAEALAAAGSVDKFKAEIEKILTDKYTAQAKEEAEENEDEQPTEDDIKASVDADLAAAQRTKSYTQSEDDDVGLWMFKDSRAVGDTYVDEPADDATTFTYTAYIITKTQYFDDYVTANARHILLSTDKYKTAEAAKTKADEILKKYNDSDTKTEEYFEKLAKENSDDVNVETNGGLYEGVTKDYNYPEAFYKWCYDSERKVGDVGVIESDSGAHVMYYSGTGDIAWKIAAKANKKNDDYEAYLKELATTYTVTNNESALDKINA